MPGAYRSLDFHHQYRQSINYRQYLARAFQHPEMILFKASMPADENLSREKRHTFEGVPTRNRNVCREKCRYPPEPNAPRLGSTAKGKKAAGLTPVLVTGSGQHSLLNRLAHNFPGMFQRDHMVTAFDVKYGKPHPEPYLMGLEKAGVQANEAIEQKMHLSEYKPEQQAYHCSSQYRSTGQAGITGCRS